MDKTILWFIRNNIVNDYFTWFMKFVSNIGNSGIIWILITLISVCAPGLTLKTLKENVD